jgi:hypothetical protein
MMFTLGYICGFFTIPVVYYAPYLLTLIRRPR